MPEPTAHSAPEDIVEGHYTRRGDLAPRILDLLAERGYDLSRLEAGDLAVVDQFHIRGHRATQELVELLSPAPDARVLDVGCGIAGPARMVAAETGAYVAALDLTESYCRDAALLNRQVGLDAQIAVVRASGTALPFADGSFALTYSQHAAMNIPDKPALYREMARVTEPGGRVAVYDVMAGHHGAPHFPVPWASTAAGSFLVQPEEVREMLLASGLEQLMWRDQTTDAVAWNRERIEKARAAAAENPNGPPPLGPHLVMGPEFKDMVANLGRNLEEGRVQVFQGVFRKPQGG